MKKKVGIFVLVLLVIIAICCAVYFGLIKKNDNNNEEEILETEETKIDWGNTYAIFLLEEEDEDIEIGLFDFNSDDIPELLVKSDDLYKIVYIDMKDEKAKVSSIEGEEIEEISLIYDEENKKYCYVFTTFDNKNEINIIPDDLTKATEIVNTSSRDYQVDYVIIKDNLQEKLEKISQKDEEKINQAIKNAESNFKTTDEYVEESGINIETETENAKEDLTDKLSEDEAFELGEDLYSYGDNFGYEYDESTNKSYIGKSYTEMVLSEIEDLRPYRAYKVEDSDVEDYFTKKRIEELSLDNEPAPYGLEKYEGSWYYCEPDLGGSYDYVGTEIEVESIESDKITYKAITYYSEEYIFDSESSDESIDEITENYDYYTKEDPFVIVREDGNWKIDEQTVRF